MKFWWVKLAYVNLTCSHYRSDKRYPGSNCLYIQNMVHCNYFHIFFFSLWHTDRTSVRLLTWVSTIFLEPLHHFLTAFLHLAADSHLLPISSSPSYPSSIQRFCFLAESCPYNLYSTFLCGPLKVPHAEVLTCLQFFFPPALLYLSGHPDPNNNVELPKEYLRSESSAGVKHIQAESPPRAQPATATPDRVPELNVAHGPEFIPGPSSVNQKMWHVWKTQKPMKPEPGHLLWHQNLTEGGG